MRILGFIIISILCVSCNTNSENKLNDNEGFSLSNIIEKHVDTLKSKQIIASKLLYNKNVFEKITQDEVALFSTLNSLKEYDINKPAYKNAYSKKVFFNYVEYKTEEQKIPIKLMRVYGNQDMPNRIYIYYDKSNNLYSSRHVVNIELYSNISIYRIQDINGLNPDSILLKTNYSITDKPLQN